jgi:COMC family
LSPPGFESTLAGDTLVGASSRIRGRAGRYGTCNLVGCLPQQHQEQALMNNLNVANFETLNLSDLDAIIGGRGWGEAIGNYVGTAIGGAAGAVGGGLGGAAVGSAVPVIGTTIGGLAGGGAGGAVGGAAGWEGGGALGKWITGGR